MLRGLCRHPLPLRLARCSSIKRIEPCFRKSFSHSAFQQQQQQSERPWSTPLAKKLFEAISITGPVPLASYMRMCLTGDLGGYYTGAIEDARDQFGTKGDFITSPEISQVFGELIGIWFVAEWMSQGSPKKGVQLIEVGPGRGTLMDDMLRTIQRFPAMANSIDAVYMVEASRELREAQKNLLCGKDAQLTQSDVGFLANGKHNGKPIAWTDSIKSISTDASNTPFIVAHEFFDALPIYAFESVSTTPSPPQGEDGNLAGKPAPSSHGRLKKESTEWREMMVSPTPLGATHADLKTPKSEQHEPVPEFQLIMSSTPTRHSKYVPESSPRYRQVKSTPGSIIEVCPDASIFASDFASRIGGSSKSPKAKPSGAALILDYGPSDTIPVNSLRGIRQHKRVNPFSAPGLVDLSADVDFTAIAETALETSEGIEVHGPVTQADFLEHMGIRQRAKMLSEAPGVSQESADKMEQSWRRLVDRGPGGMGKLYKALAIIPENSGRRRPAGFGGDVQG